MKLFLIIILICCLQACSTTGVKYVENTPEEGKSLVYVHSDCLQGSFYKSGTKVFLNKKFVNFLWKNGYLEISVIPGEHSLRVELSGSAEANINFEAKANERVYIMYSSFAPGRSEIGNIVHALKGTKDNTSLSEYPELYSKPTMKNCMKIEKTI